MTRMRLVLSVCFLGACASGESALEGAAPDANVSPDACVAQAEVCNGADDDCDDAIDEDIADLGASCMVGTGECTAAGHYVCDVDGGVVCDASSGTPEGELCNGADDDCDTMIDEGLHVGEDCDGADTDMCIEGHVACVDDSAVCDDTTSNSVELCNGADDDCLNGADDPWPVGDPCTAGIGACAASGTYQCNTTTSVACDATPGTAGLEYCGDSVDSDCSGGTDPTCPDNDLPGGATDISAGGVWTADLTYAHDNHTVGTCGLPAGGGRDVYYRFNLPAAEVVYLDTFNSNFDTVLRLYSGTCTSIASEMVCRDDACGVLQGQQAMQLAAGNYCLVVDQFGNGQTNGSLTLTFRRGGHTGTSLSTGVTNGTLSGTTTGGTSTQSSTSCQPNASGNDVGYYFTLCPGVSHTFSASNCSDSWDSILNLRRGSTTALCSDDACGASTRQSSIPATTISGPDLFLLTIDGWSGANGAYSVTYSN